MGRLGDFFGAKEIKQGALWRDAFVEALLTFFLIVSVTAVPLALNSSEGSPTFVNGLAIGFTVFVVVEASADLTVGYINPVVPFLLFCSREISVVRAIVMIAAEISGSAAGSGFVWGLTSDTYRRQISPLSLNSAAGVSQVQGVFLEAQQTLLLMLVVLATSDPKNKSARAPTMAPGFVVALNIMVFGKYTGGCMNPVVAFGPAAVSNKWTNHWVYWVGPYVGGILALLFYRGIVTNKIFTRHLKQYEMKQDQPAIENPRGEVSTVSDGISASML